MVASYKLVVALHRDMILVWPRTYLNLVGFLLLLFFFTKHYLISESSVGWLSDWLGKTS